MFSHLHVHTPYSFLDGASDIEALVREAASQGMIALAMTDHNSVAAAVKFVEACRGYGIKPILGAEITMEDESHLTLLARDRAGYAELCRLITLAHAHGGRLTPRLPWAEVESRESRVESNGGPVVGTLLAASHGCGAPQPPITGEPGDCRLTIDDCRLDGYVPPVIGGWGADSGAAFAEGAGGSETRPYAEPEALRPDSPLLPRGEGSGMRVNGRAGWEPTPTVNQTPSTPSSRSGKGAGGLGDSRLATRDSRLFSYDHIPFGDPQTFRMFRAGAAVGTFQFESAAQMALAATLQQENFEDLVAAVALIRPGPIRGNVVKRFVACRNGWARADVLHPSLADTLAKTYGCIVYQEQVNDVVAAMTGCSDAEADRFRKRLKRHDKLGRMDEARAEFVDAALARHADLTEEQANLIFDQIEGWSGYGFIEGHAAAFALTGYRSAYLSVHHPAPYYAGLMNHQPMGYYSSNTLAGEARRRGVRVLPVDINRSDDKCFPEEPDAIRLGLRVVADLREQDIADILAAREEGEFASLVEFCGRVPLHRNRLENLILCGAFDSLHEHRRGILWRLDETIGLGLAYRGGGVRREAQGVRPNPPGETSPPTPLLIKERGDSGGWLSVGAGLRPARSVSDDPSFVGAPLAAPAVDTLTPRPPLPAAGEGEDSAARPPDAEGMLRFAQHDGQRESSSPPVIGGQGGGPTAGRPQGTAPTVSAESDRVALSAAAGEMVALRDGSPRTAPSLEGGGRGWEDGRAGGLGASRLTPHASRLLCLSGCRRGLVAQLVRAHRYAEAKAAAIRLRDAFGADSFFIELQDDLTPDSRRVNRELALLADKIGVDVVATNNVHYARPDGYAAHDIMRCVAAGVTVTQAHPLRPLNSERYLKTAAQMAELFAWRPDAIANTMRIAEQCECALPDDGDVTPGYPVPAGHADAAAYLRHLTYKGGKFRYGTLDERTTARIEHELSVITKLGYADYFLMVWDIVRWARKNGIRCTGRGSAADSCVAYCLYLTDVEVISRKLPFARFLAPGKMPDIDIDFPSERRDDVFRHIIERYGAEHVGMVCTFHTFWAKSAVRDIGKALELPPEALAFFSERLSHHIHADRIDAAFEKHAELRPYAAQRDRFQLLFDLCGRIAGFPRHIGTHSSGIVISRVPLSAIAPLQPSARGLTQIWTLDKDDAEAIGAIKFDVLSLRILSAVGDAERGIKAGVRREAWGVRPNPPGATSPPTPLLIKERGDCGGGLSVGAGLRPARSVSDDPSFVGALLAAPDVDAPQPPITGESGLCAAGGVLRFAQHDGRCEAPSPPVIGGERGGTTAGRPQGAAPTVDAGGVGARHAVPYMHTATGEAPALPDGRAGLRPAPTSDQVSTPPSRSGKGAGGVGAVPPHPTPHTPHLPLGSLRSVATPVAWDLEDFSAWDKFLWTWRITGICAECHVFTYLRDHLQRWGIVTTYEAMQARHNARVTVAGLNVRPHRPPTRSGEPVIFTLIEDESGLMHATIAGEAIERCTSIFLTSPAVIVRGLVKRQGRGAQLLVEKVKPLRMAEMAEAAEDLDSIWERPWKMGANVQTRMVGTGDGARGAHGKQDTTTRASAKKVFAAATTETR